MAKKEQDPKPSQRPAKPQGDGLMTNILRAMTPTEEQLAERQHPRHRRNQVRLEDLDD
jgi:hypothetical protein